MRLKRGPTETKIARISRMQPLTGISSLSAGHHPVATALHVAVYNFCRMHRTPQCTRAMAGRVVPDLSSTNDLLGAVMDERRNRLWMELYKRLGQKLQEK